MPGNPNTHYSAKLYLGVADGTANATTVISDPYLFVRENGSNTAVQLKGGTGINISGINGAATISLANTTVTAGTYGPSADVSGANGNVIKVPQITVDAQGRVTSVIEKEYTSVDTNTDTNTAHAHSNPANSGLKLTGTGGTSGTVQYSVNTDFTTSASARKYKVEVDSTSGGLYVNVPWTDTNTDTNTTYTAGTGLTLNSTTFSLATSGVTEGKYGPSADVNGSNGAKINVPEITVDAYGRVTKVTNRVYTSVNTDTNTNTAHSHTAGTGLTISGSGGTSGTTTYSANLNSTTSLGTIGTTSRLYAVGVDKNGKLCVNVPWTDTNTDTNTTYSAGTGLSLSGTTFNLTNTGVTANTYGPSANVSGSNGATISVPQITVDAQGRITSIVNRTYTSVDTNTNTTYSAGTGISLSGTTFSNSGVRSIATGTANGTISVNTGGTTANVAVKGLGSAAYTNSSAYAPASHGTHVTTATVKSALGTGSGTTKFLREDGNWATPAYYTLTKAKVEAVLTGDITSHTHSQLSPDSTLQYGRNTLQYFNASLGTTASATANYAPTADWYHIIRMNHGNAQGYCVDIAACFHSDNLYLRRLAAGANTGYKHIWIEGNSITGAVWNDYAEYRESDCEEFGRVLMENGDDTLSITTDRLQPFAGISSDTWGFCQGETEKAKTPIAVAGRVLAYPYQNRDNYKPGDCVCSAPNGTVDIMTREEVVMYPDRIIGTVSCVPNYETWGSGDRDPVQVDGRIWIKVK